MERRLARNLEAEAELPLTWFEVLLRVARSPDGAAHDERALRAARAHDRRRDAARRPDRRGGYVERCPAEHDRRVIWAVVTPRGHEVVEHAAEVHAAELHDIFANFTTKDRATSTGCSTACAEACAGDRGGLDVSARVPRARRPSPRGGARRCRSIRRPRARRQDLQQLQASRRQLDRVAGVELLGLVELGVRQPGRVGAQGADARQPDASASRPGSTCSGWAQLTMNHEG